MMVRVLQINNEFPPLGGGTATVTFEFCKHACLDEHVIQEVVTSSGIGVYESSRELAPNCLVTKLALKQKCIHHATVFDLARFIVSAFLYCAISLRHKAFDVILAWSSVPAGVVALLLNRLFGVPYIVRVSGPDIPGFERRYRFIYPCLRPILKLVWRFSKVVVCKCQEEASRVLEVLPSVEVMIVPNGVDTEKFHPPVLRPSRNRLSILCVARLIERKGQDIAIRALARLRALNLDVSLILVGDGDKKETYEKLAISLNIAEFVEFRGAVSRWEMPEIYRSADIFFLPSTAESMSIACLEALATGLPLVISAGGGAENFVEHGRNGFLISNGDTDAFFGALLTLLNDKSLRVSCGHRSRKLAHNFTWSVTCKGLLDALRGASQPSP